MKELLEAFKLEEDLLFEMATFGSFENFEVAVFSGDEGSIPHVHVRDVNSKGDGFHTCVRLDKPEYFHHTGKEDSFNSRQRKAFNNFMKQEYEDDPLNNWKLAVLLWNRTNSNTKIDKDKVEQPDYTKLPNKK